MRRVSIGWRTIRPTHAENSEKNLLASSETPATTLLLRVVQFIPALFVETI
jgi:hypothetical protein